MIFTFICQSVVAIIQGVFLFFIDVDKTCYATNSSDSPITPEEY